MQDSISWTHYETQEVSTPINKAQEHRRLNGAALKHLTKQTEKDLKWRNYGC